VLYAARQRKEGKSLTEVYDWLFKNRLKLCHFFTVDDLFYLFRGGRVQKSSYLIGSILNIKPVMHMDDEGRLVAMERVTGRKRSLTVLADLVASRIVEPEKQTIAISHGDCIDAVDFLVERLNERIKYKEIIVNYVDPVVGAHSGPGTVAVFCLGTKR
jgi:EDD domain protein, DegV family